MSSSVLFIYLVGWNRLMYIFCGVNTWQNGTRCRDGVKVLWKLHVSSAGSVWYVGSFKLCCEILLLLNVAESDMDCLLCGRLWSEQC